MYITKILFLLLIVISCNNSGGEKMPKGKKLKANNDLNNFLKEGFYKAEYYPSKEVTPTQRATLQKFSKLIETNKKTQQFLSALHQNEILDYHPAIGISKKEYNDLVELFSYKPEEKSNGMFTVEKKKDKISFRGVNGLLDSITVGVEGTTASFKNYDLGINKDSIDMSSEEIPDGQTLDRYIFYTGPGGILGLSGLEGEYELLIGKLKPSGKTYLFFFAKQPDILEHPIPKYITVIF